MDKKSYPEVISKEKVGTYPASVFAGGGYVWDEVLEYRVWCYIYNGAPDLEEGCDYYYAFATYQEALEFSKNTKGTEKPIALILQKEYIDEPEKGKFFHIKKERITEWRVEFLERPRREENTIPDFLKQKKSS